MPNRTNFARTMLMPLVMEAGSLDRMAAKIRPDVGPFHVHDQQGGDGEHDRDDGVHLQSVGDADPEGAADLHVRRRSSSYPARCPHELLDHECEAERQEREVQVADAQARQRDQQAERHRDERAGEDRQPHRPAGLGGEPSRREHADAREGDLAQRDQAPSPVTSVYER